MTETAIPGAEADAAPPLGGAPPDGPPDAPSDRPNPDGLRGLLLADPELTEDERSQLAAIADDGDFARAWHEAVVEQAARERAEALREEIRDELAAGEAARREAVRESQPQPTRALAGALPPPPEPADPRSWADWIHETDDAAERGRRRDRFADWMRRNPGV